MPIPKYTGNDFIDRLGSDAIRRNPEYNPKTKKGKKQPQYIDIGVGDINKGGYNNTVKGIRELQFSNATLGYTPEEFDELSDDGINVNAYTEQLDVDKARAKNQSVFEQAGNFLMRAGVGEVVIGTGEGFLNIIDGFINSFTGDNYDRTWLSQQLHDAKTAIDENFKIYREDPNATFAFGDTGWWFDNAVSVATTASLMLPVYGYGKAAGLLGKLTKLDKAANWAANWAANGLARGIAKASTKMGKANKEFAALDNYASQTNRIAESIKGGVKVTASALSSRMGENMIEARQVYDDVYTKSLENLKGMDDAAYNKFLADNPDLQNMSKEEQAKEIARQSANRTFQNDFAMLLMDIPQFKALGKLWGKGMQRATTAAERIEAENIKRQLADMTGSQLLKNNIWNRTKEGVKYALKNPKDSFLALELGEGFEELYQGIQSEKGMEVMARHFDPAFNARTLNSYLTDFEMWEQGFWGSIGGIAFNKLGRALTSAEDKVTDMRNKRTMKPEEYTKWKNEQKNRTITNIQAAYNDALELAENMKYIREGKNPFNYSRTPGTGTIKIKDDNVVLEEIDEQQQDLLAQDAINKFLTKRTFNHIDNGTFDLFRAIIGSNEFDQFLNEKGVNLTSADKSVFKEINAAVDNIAATYNSEVNNVNYLADATNPYVSRLVARKIAADKLRDAQFNEEVSNIDARIAERNTEGINYDTYKDRILNDYIQESLKELKTLEKQTNDDTKISKQAKTRKLREIEAKRKSLLDIAAKETTSGLFDSVKELMKDEKVSTVDLIKEYDKFVDNLKKTMLASAVETPTAEINNLINQRAQTRIYQIYDKADIPTSNEDYKQMYEDFAISLDKLINGKVNDAIDRIAKYLTNADDFEDALNKARNGETGDEKIDEAAEILKLGYIPDSDKAARGTGQMEIETLFSVAVSQAREAYNRKHSIASSAASSGLTVVPSTTGSTSTGGGTTSASTAAAATPSRGVTPTPTPAPAPTTTASPTSSPAFTAASSSAAPAVAAPSATPAPTASPTAPVTASTPTPEGAVSTVADDEKVALEKNNARLETGKYVIISLSRNPALADILSDPNNASNYDQFKSDIISYLKSKGFSDDVINATIDKAISDAINTMASADTKGTFAKIALNMAMGYDPSADDSKKSITQILSGKPTNELVEKFLEAYANEVKGCKISGDRYIININSLFEELLNNDEISYDTARDIYKNIFSYIANHNGSKFLFTGNVKEASYYTATQFFNFLEDKKGYNRASVDSMHIFLTEQDYRDDDFYTALESAANGNSKIFARRGKNSANQDTHIEIYTTITKKGKPVDVKLGVVRYVDLSADNNHISPKTHYSGFRNEITINGGNISLDCDFLFDALIERDTAAGQELFDMLVDYNFEFSKIYNDKTLSPKEKQKAIANIITDEIAAKFLANPLIDKMLKEQHWRPYKEMTDRQLTANFMSAISTISFHDGGGFKTETEHGIERIAVDKPTMRASYERWKHELLVTYGQTYEIQKGLEKSDSYTIGDLHVPTEVSANIIQNKEDYVNVGDAGLLLDRNPFVMINNAHEIVDEDGNVLGHDFDLQPYSMGYVIYNDEDSDHVIVAGLNDSLPIKGSPLYQDLYEDIVKLITDQLNVPEDADQQADFEYISRRIKELIGPGGVFRIPSKYGNRNAVQIWKTNNKIEVQIETGKDSYKSLFALFANQDKFTGQKFTTVAIRTNDSANAWERINDAGKADPVPQIQSLVAELLENVTVNRMSAAFDVNSGATRGTGYRQGKKFILNLNGKEHAYNSYGEFILQSRGFKMAVDGNEGFVNSYIDESRANVDMQVKGTNPILDNIKHTDTAVSDLFKDAAKHKTVPTVSVLRASGLEEDRIDVLTGKNTGMPIVSKVVKYDNTSNPDDGFAYWTPGAAGGVYITAAGVSAMNGDKENTLRLILHENLHRLFNGNAYTDAQRKRIIDELKEVHEYVIQKINERIAENPADVQLYKDMLQIFEAATSYKDDATNMEEFLVECLTQRPITEFLNNTLYKDELIEIQGLNEAKKSIFQKILDILLKLLGSGTHNIKNNSILAKEYMILSRTNKSTSTGLFRRKADGTVETKPATPAVSAPTSSPVEGEANVKRREALVKAKDKVLKIKNTFEKRITRRADFRESHVYLLDGTKEIDTSVSTVAHPSSGFDTTKYFPASLFGNTFDDAARVYFENDFGWPADYHIPNTDHEDDLGKPAVNENSDLAVKQMVEQIHAKLDEIYGKGNYGVITTEFPIGSQIQDAEGNWQTMAGTMDMIVYTADGEIHIYDFKTKRGGNLDENTKHGYSQQVNLYRQVIEASFPEFKGQVHAKGLFVATTAYPDGNKTDTVYSEQKDKDGNYTNQLLVNGVPIQDSGIDYNIGYFKDDFFVPLKDEDMNRNLDKLPDIIPNDENKGSSIPGTEIFDEEGFINMDDFDPYAGEDDEIHYAKTEMLLHDNDIIDKEFIPDEQWLEDYDKATAPLIAPNGKQSKLNWKQWHEVRSPEFIRWAGDWIHHPKSAKVILDEETGEPKVVYHTVQERYNSDFNKFNTRIEGRKTAIYHTDDMTMSISYNEYQAIKNRKGLLKLKMQFSIEHIDAINKILNSRNTLHEVMNKIQSEDVKDGEKYWQMDKRRNEYWHEYLKNIGVNRGLGIITINDFFKDYNTLIKNLANTKATIQKQLNIFENQLDPVNKGVIKHDYIRMSKPLVIDAEGEGWNNINFKPNITTEQKAINDELDKILNDYIDNSPIYVQDAFGDWFNGDQTFYEIVNFFHDGDLKNKLNSIGRYKESERLSTRDLENKYRNSEYDGIIIHNVMDYGQDIGVIETPHTVYISYNRNDIKSSTHNDGSFTESANIKHAKTNALTTNEIYANPSHVRTRGNKTITSMNDFINSYPSQFQDGIKLLLDSGVINYSCS